MSRKKTEEPGAPSVPAYIVTFSDMVTLLLTFFVLLLSMAEEENKEKFQAIQEAFKSRITSFGVKGILFSEGKMDTFNCQWINNPIKEQDPDEQLTPINVKEEQLRRLFSKINDRMQTRPSQIKGKLADIIVPNFKFGSAAQLSHQAINYLTEICSELNITLSEKTATIYVVGLSQSGSSSKSWFDAAKKAELTADFIKSKLSPYVSIYSWGTTDASEWIASTKAKDIESDIIISIIQ